MPEVAERSTVDILRAARERITPRDRWDVGSFALDGGGYSTAVSDPAACKWCAEGSLAAEIYADGPTGRYPLVRPVLRESEAYRFLLRAAAPRMPVWVNDNSGHDAVLEMFDAAIQLAEQEAN